MQVTATAQLSKDSDLTILVPTYKRAQLLPSCLLSIAGQSRKDLIKEVIVSENSGDAQSREVASAFSDQLPIRYIQQVEALTAQQHFIWLVQQVKTKYAALICDDDMWSSYHIEEAMRSFEENPTIHSFYGQAIVVENATCHPQARYSGSFLQVPSFTTSEPVDFRVWDRRQTAINCLANTALNISAVVALSDALKLAMITSAGDPEFGQYPSCDRFLIWRLSLQGDIAIGRNISLFYRGHSGSHTASLHRDTFHEFCASDLAISKEIARQANLLGLNAYEDWQLAYKSFLQHGLATERFDLWNPMIKDWLLKDQNSDEIIPEIHAKRQLHERLRKYMYLFTPPILGILSQKTKRSTLFSKLRNLAKR
ncbi:MAG: glycosyltransferase family A protein [Cyanobacteria bacterium]|nr:glycosyltransferase family A protein [Cyanobacteriota bacterium]